MDFTIYPFKRYDKYRLYVRFNDQYDNEITLSTGVSYSFEATKKQIRQARHKAIESGRKIVVTYQSKHQALATEQSANPQLSAFLKQDYYPHVVMHCQPSTLVSYKGALSHFQRICHNRKMNQYKRIDLERYKQVRHNKEGIRKTTINIEIRSIKAAFNWAYNYDLIGKNPFKGNGFMFDVKPNRRAFTKKEIAKLLEVTEGEPIGWVIRLTYFTGMRIGEISSLTWDMIRLEDKPYIHLPKEITKSAKSRDIPLGEKAMKIILKLEERLEEKKKQFPSIFNELPEHKIHVLIKERGWGQYKKRSIQDMFRKVMREEGLPEELTFHCLRHSFATHVLPKSGNLIGVSKILGHSTTQVTQQFYDHTTALNYRDVADLI